MKIQLFSDLHLESNPHWQPQPAPDADVLVLAGDIVADDHSGLARFSPHHGWPTPVLFVPGNHEYDRQDWDSAHARLQESCARLGITWLERKSIVLNGVRFIGTTLWTDFDALCPNPQGEKALARQLKTREKAFRAANFYLEKAQTTRNGQPWRSNTLREQNWVCRAWLHEALTTPSPNGEPTVVISHFAPSLLSADPRYGVVVGTAGFCNALDDWLHHANVWLHGHLHAPCHYTHNGCRVVANPLGYAAKNEQWQFMPQLLVTVDSATSSTPESHR